MLSEKVELCAQLIKNAQSIAVLTGGGISTKAGIPDFRGPKGLYVTRQYDPQTIFDINYFLSDPLPFFDFARDFTSLAKTIKPTTTHYFLQKLEEQYNLKGVITQNIDSLHQRAGTNSVYEMHGSFYTAHCLNCDKAYNYETLLKLISEQKIPQCKCEGVIKSDIVFFGEEVKFLQKATTLAQKSDLFLVLGTSCVVQPAASIPEYTSGKVIVVNQGEVNLRSCDVQLNIQEDCDNFFEKVNQFL